MNRWHLIVISLYWASLAVAGDGSCESANVPCDCLGATLETQSLKKEAFFVQIRKHSQFAESANDTWTPGWTKQEILKQREGQEVTAEGKYNCQPNRNGDAKLDKINILTENRIDLSGEKLRGVCFRKSDLRNAILDGADLRDANFYKADLSGASLIGANLGGANLDCANLKRVGLKDATLKSANLYRAMLDGAFVENVDFSDSRFEPTLTPPVRNLINAKGFDQVWYGFTPNALTTFRSELKSTGAREYERQITYAIRHQQRKEMVGLEAVAQYLFFEATVKFGMSPWRPLKIIAFLIVALSVVYAYALRDTNKTDDGIWKIWTKYRIYKPSEKLTPVMLRLPLFNAVAVGLYFSVLSAFRIGWRDINMGNWIEQINPHEYQLAAIGWVKTVAGIQSIISVYLIGLWVLSYFGSPFD